MMNTLACRPAVHLAARRGFTLIEILVVVVILGVLAAIVIPQFSNASEKSRESALKQDCFRLRQQLELYKMHHNGNYPPLATFIEQMTLSSDKDGNTAAIGTDGYPYGPYMPFMPKNPFTDTVPLGDGAVGSSAWYYNQATGEIAPNDSVEHRSW